MSKRQAASPWPAIMQFGLGVLRLAPSDFWSMSLPELHAAMKAHVVNLPAPISRAELEQLMRQHPDGQKEPAS